MNFFDANQLEPSIHHMLPIKKEDVIDGFHYVSIPGTQFSLAERSYPIYFNPVKGEQMYDSNCITVSFDSLQISNSSHFNLIGSEQSNVSLEKKIIFYSILYSKQIIL